MTHNTRDIPTADGEHSPAHTHPPGLTEMQVVERDRDHYWHCWKNAESRNTEVFLAGLIAGALGWTLILGAVNWIWG